MAFADDSFFDQRVHEIKRRDYNWWIGFGALILLSAVILTNYDREWFHCDISFVYALFASLWLAITGVLIVLLAGIIGGWFFDWMPPLRSLADRVESRSARLFLALAVLIGIAVIVTALWILKDVPIEPYDDF